MSKCDFFCFWEYHNFSAKCRNRALISIAMELLVIGTRYSFFSRGTRFPTYSNHEDKFYATAENQTWDLPHARRLHNHCAMEAGIDKISHTIIYLVCTDFFEIISPPHILEPLVILQNMSNWPAWKNWMYTAGLEISTNASLCQLSPETFYNHILSYL